MVSTLLLSIQNAQIIFGDKTLFKNLSFNIQEGDKICLIGSNGAGKTTLMNMMTGQKELDEGTRWLLQGTQIGYLKQDIIPKPKQTVYDFVFEELNTESKNETHQYKIERIIDPLHLNLTDSMASLSGGQRRRAALARALVESPDILLLDEPTNHLDMDVIEWLENYLASYRGALICVSHDKVFLENISDKIFWLDRGALRVCPKGFKHFESWSLRLLEQEERELQNRQKNLDMEMAYASRGVKARRKRNVSRLNQMKEERVKLRADKNELSSMMAKINYAPEAQEQATSRLIAEFYNVCKNYSSQIKNQEDTIILDHFSLRIKRGDRIGIVGKNGAGSHGFDRRQKETCSWRV